MTKKSLFPFDVMFVFAFGEPKTTLTNRNLWAHAQGRVGQCGLVITQQDIPVPQSPKIFVAPQEDYISTLGILKFGKALESFRQEKWESILVVAVGPHIKRVLRDAKKVFPDAKMVGEVPDHDFPYSPDSAQRKTTSAWRWWPQETIIRLLPWPVYEKVAGGK